MSEKMSREELRSVLEALLMTADTPATPGKLLALLEGVTGKQLRQAVDELNEAYREGGHAMTIAEVAGGYQVVTRREYGSWVRTFHERGQARLSQAALETLAIIAFKQPVTRIEVDKVRGVDSAGVVRTLLELDLVRIVGRSEGVGRPMVFGTTRQFMSHFGLKSLADLPKPRELEELLADVEGKASENGQPSETAGDPVGQAPSAADTESDVQQTGMPQESPVDTNSEPSTEPAAAGVDEMTVEPDENDNDGE
ncbi:MAG: SMC-Scp complex subunit ScpB [Candidatus Latescibacterota bacterium]|nr:SMC-Scp complex subunit ScpB [Candidatus Latescibacterota bacterium]